MGWRVLRAGFLVVKDAEKTEKADRVPEPVQWVSLLYECNTKWMKLEVRETKMVQLPQMSLILKPPVSITFASNDPTFIVCVESKRVGNVTLCFSPYSYDTVLSPADVLEWQTLFKSAISPRVTYAVTMVREEEEQPAIICVTDRSVQLSVAERATHTKHMQRKNSSVISTDVDGIKLTIEDTLMLTLNKESVTLRTNRLIELYQHLMSYFTGRRTETGNFDIANFDYVNTRRESRNKVLEEDEDDALYIPYEDPNTYGYIAHSPSPNNTPNSSPSTSRRSHTPDMKPSRKPPGLPSEHDLVRSAVTKLPKIAPQHLGITFSKPEPPPKPKNAREILSEFEDKRVDSFYHSSEPLYKSIRKPKSTISTSLIGIQGLSETADSQEPPPLPATPPEYATPQLAVKKGSSFLTQPSGHNPEVDYINVPPRRSSEIPRPVPRPNLSSRRTSEDNLLFTAHTTRFINRQKAIRSPARPSLQEDEENELYDSIYALGIYSDPSDTANLPPPRDSWLTEGESLPANSHQEDFPPFTYQQNLPPRKVLLSKIQLFDKNILRKVN